MSAFFLRRLAGALFTCVLVVTATFVIVRLGPGDPATAVLGEHASQQAIQELRKAMGLDDALVVQYGRYVGGLLRLDLGRTLVGDRPIWPEVRLAITHTFKLVVASFIVGIFVGIPLGLICGIRSGGRVDALLRIASLVGVAVPIFVLGVVFLLIFGLWLGWFPTMGEGNPNKLLDQVWHVVLPALTLGWMLSGFLVRAMRASVLEILHEDYVRTAAAKGLSFVTIVRKHVLRNALSGVVTVAGIYLGILLGGTVVIEEVFDRPGLGSLLIGAIRQHDFNLVQSGLVVFSLIVIAVNLCVDLSYGVIDPRIRYD